MTTSYKEPRIEIEQQFTATASSTYLPELRACIVAPFYDMVEEESVGTYANVEEEYNWASVRPVDVRTGTNADELTYPLTVTLKEAVTEVVSNKAGGAIDGTVDPYIFNDSTGTFTYPLPTGVDMFLKFDSAAYRHDFGATTIAADDYILRFTAATGVCPALNDPITDSVTGATLKTTAVYDVEGVVVTPGATVPTAGFIRANTLLVGVFGAGNACTANGGAPAGFSFTNTAQEEDHYILTSVSPLFYQDLDFLSAISGTISLTVAPATTKTGTVTNFVSANEIWLRSADMHAGGTAIDTGFITRATISSAEQVLRAVRSVSSATSCRLSIARTGVGYSAVTYDIFERLEYEISIDDFSDWGIVLDTDGVIIPTALVTPDDSFHVTAANVYLTYRALRTDLADELEYYESTDALETEFGTTTKYNTGAYMTYLALLNANGRPIYVTGLEEDYLTSPLTAYSSALSYLEDKRVYALACASMLPAVHTLVNAHINLCSTAEQGSWRIGINCHTLAEYETLVNSMTTGAGYVDIYREGFTGNRFVDASATWLSLGVDAGDSIYVTGWTGIEKTLLDTYTAGGGKVLTVSDWDSDDTTVTLTTIADPGVSLRGKTVVIHGINDTVSIDGGTYSDHTRAGAEISTAQTYTALGYKVISSSWSSNVLTLHIYTSGTDVLVGAIPATSDYIEVYDGPLSLAEESAILNDYTEIGSVIADDMALATFKSGYTGVYTGVTYQIRKLYDRDEMAENYAAYTSSFDNRRMNFVFPHVYQDSDGTQMNGYFVAAAEAGWIGGAYAHQSITSQNLQGFYRLLYSNKYFKKSQLNEIAGGGVTIYTQEVDNAGITCRHQLTTDLESILTQENSITRSVDTGAYMLLDALNPLKGRYNIVDDLYTVINTKVNAVRGLLCEKKYSRYGSILKKFEVKTLIQDPNAQDGLYLEIECETQKPFNRATVLIKVS
jgi:hypothetical protein